MLCTYMTAANQQLKAQMQRISDHHLTMLHQVKEAGTTMKWCVAAEEKGLPSPPGTTMWQVQVIERKLVMGVISGVTHWV